MKYHKRIDWELVAIWSVFGGLIALLGLVIYSEVVSEKFYLRKDEWKCSASHDVTDYIPQQIGNTTIYIPSTRSVCDSYIRGT